MFGKGSLIVAAGFSMMMGYYSVKLNRLTVTTADSFNINWVNASVHEAAISGMNYGINRVWQSNEDVDTGHFTIYSPQCTTEVALLTLGSDSVLVRSIARSRVYEDEYFLDNSRPSPVIDTVYAYFSNNTPISRWAAYSNQDNGIEWTTGDTAWGPVHCNHNLRTNGSPVFYGKVTARLGISPNPCGNGNRSQFLGGWEIGINAPLPTNMNNIRNRANQDNDGAPYNTKCVYNQDLNLKFLADGRLVRRVGAGASDTVTINSIAPTGLIYCMMNLTVSGVVNGSITLIVDQTIYIENDLVYAANPLTDENCDDILGLIAVQNIIVVDNVANNSDVNINGCLFAVTGSFTAQNYSSRPVAGRLTVIGSIAQAGRGHVGTVSPWTGSVTHGFSKSYYYDPRLKYMSPPYFPSIKEPRLVSWWE
jgi:hypothetical protein